MTNFVNLSLNTGFDPNFVDGVVKLSFNCESNAGFSINALTNIFK